MVKKDIVSVLKGKKVVLYGDSSLGIHYLQRLESKGIYVDCFVVSDGYKSKEYLCGKTVYALKELPYAKNECSIIRCISERYEEEIVRNLNEQGYPISDITLNDIEIAYIEKYLEKYKIAFEKDYVEFGNIKVKNIFDFKKNFDYITHLFFLSLGDCIFPSAFAELDLIEEGAYEIENVRIEEGDVLFDCGANIGAFSCVGAAKGASVYAFEPQADYKDAILKISDSYRDRIHYSGYALSNEIGEVILRGEGVSASILDSGESKKALIPTITIDEFIKRNKIEKVDFIKADIEGAERLMLAGAKETLAQMSPKLAICSYHLPDDKSVLENLIMEANPNYIVEHRWKKIFAYIPEKEGVSHVY